MDGPRQQYGNDDRPLQSGTSIEVDNVSFVYRDDNLVLKNINLCAFAQLCGAGRDIPAVAKAPRQFIDGLATR